MEDITLRKATLQDIPFLIETIMEAEKAGTDTLPYTSIFDLTESEIKKYLEGMLMEEIDGCELSVSSFLVAEKNKNLIAASCAWIEGLDGVPSAIIKGNLLNYYIPKKNIEKARGLSRMLNELHFEHKPNCIYFGAGYVTKANRGNNMLGILKMEQIAILAKKNRNITEAYVDIFANNIPAIKINEKLDFEIISEKETSNKDILLYLPSNKKILMKKELKQ